MKITSIDLIESSRIFTWDYSLTTWHDWNYNQRIKIF